MSVFSLVAHGQAPRRCSKADSKTPKGFALGLAVSALMWAVLSIATSL